MYKGMYYSRLIDQEMNCTVLRTEEQNIDRRTSAYRHILYHESTPAMSGTTVRVVCSVMAQSITMIVRSSFVLMYAC